MAIHKLFSKILLTQTYHTTSVSFSCQLTSETTVHYNLLKLLPWVDLDQFFGNGKFSNLSFYIENVTVMNSLEIIADFDLEIG